MVTLPNRILIQLRLIRMHVVLEGWECDNCARTLIRMIRECNCRTSVEDEWKILTILNFIHL